MDDQAREAAFMSALVTEHSALQSAASTTVSESASRASLYFLSLSSSLVAIGFAAGAPAAFEPFAATIIPAVFVVGVFTVVRLADTGVENIQSLRAIARIRRYYATLSPDARRFFDPLASAEDISAEALAMIAVRPSPFLLLFTAASMVGVVNGLVGGVGIALAMVAVAGDGAAPIAVGLGALVTAVSIVLVVLYQRQRYAEMDERDRRRGEDERP